MKIVIVGAGGVGTWLVRLLAQEHHEITVIDTKAQLIESLTDHYEVSGICGSGASYSILKKAGMEAVDAFLAVTSSDEANIMACQIAKELGAGHTVARVSGREYLDDIEYFRQRSGIDYVINPELEVAEEILYLLQLPSAVNLQPFMDGSVLLLELNITEHHPLAGMSLYEMRKNFGVSVLVATVTRGDKTFVPRGNFVLQPEDEISVLAPSVQMEKLLEQLNVVKRKVRKVMMVGCGRIGQYLTEKLQKTDMKLKIIEFDRESCRQLSEQFPGVKVAYGESLDEKLLSEEGLDGYDACVSLTEADARNLVVSMLAWSRDVPKVITKVLDVGYASVLSDVQLDNTVSPYEICANNILRYIRVLENTEHLQQIRKLYRLADNQVEVLELSADRFAKFGVELRDKELKLRPDILVATIIRNGVVQIPDGHSTIEPGDKVIVVSAADVKVSDLDDILQEQ
ncbi:MAG: Trk system potassium transporter TrkA [Erysipelotrichaceae bacterium]|nr:Trk system potassium transporter TrkA [Erysipelotrichaceae bacterium]